MYPRVCHNKAKITVTSFDPKYAHPPLVFRRNIVYPPYIVITKNLLAKIQCNTSSMLRLA